MGKVKVKLTFSEQVSQNVTNASVLNTPGISDHRFVRIEANIKCIWRKPKSSARKYNIEALKNDETSDLFQIEIANRFLPLLDSTPEDVEDFSNIVNEKIIEVAENVTPPLRSSPPLWIQSDTLRAIDNKKAVRKKHGETSIYYKVSKAETKKLVKRDKMNQLNDNLPPDKLFSKL